MALVLGFEGDRKQRRRPVSRAREQGLCMRFLVHFSAFRLALPPRVQSRGSHGICSSHDDACCPLRTRFALAACGKPFVLPPLRSLFNGKGHTRECSTRPRLYGFM